MAQASTSQPKEGQPGTAEELVDLPDLRFDGKFADFDRSNNRQASASAGGRGCEPVACPRTALRRRPRDRPARRGQSEFTPSPLPHPRLAARRR